MRKIERIWNLKQKEAFLQWLKTMETSPEGVKRHHLLRKKMRHERLSRMYNTTIWAREEMSAYDLFDLDHMPAWLQDHYLPPACPGGAKLN